MIIRLSVLLLAMLAAGAAGDPAAAPNIAPGPDSPTISGSGSDSDSTAPTSGGSTVTGEDVELAIRRAVDFIWSRQNREGQWDSREFETVPGGLTALAAYTVRMAGTPLSDHRLHGVVQQLRSRTDLNTVYARAFTLMLWSGLGIDQFKHEMAEDVRYLKIQQSKDGGWGYGTTSDVGPGKGWTDNSNSQLALLALSEAAWAGADVSAAIWRRAERSWLSQANPDGGWGYPISDDPNYGHYPRQSTGSMTAAGLASLYLIYDQLYLDAELPFNGRFIAKCGQDIEDTRPIRQAMHNAWNWLATRFQVEVVPELPEDSASDLGHADLTYYLFGLDRVGVAGGRKYIGGHQWSAEVAAQLVHTQREDGSWGNVNQTCFGVLALLKLRTPVLVNKLRYGEGDSWNTNPRDAANLTRWFSRRCETPLTWQVVELSEANNDVYDAPVLLITGHEAPELTEVEQRKLRSFVDAGGTVLAVACCSKSEFYEGAHRLFSSLFPNLTAGLLPADHPAWSVHDVLDPGPECTGFSDGYRTSIFLLNNAACCAWQQNLTESEHRRFQFAGNILVYATHGRSPRSRLTPFVEAEVALPNPVRTVWVSRMIHGGDWWIDPAALRHLHRRLSPRIGLGIEERAAVRAEDVSSSTADMLVLAGHTFTPPTAFGESELRGFLRNGGTLVASACSGQEEFDGAFQRFARELFGDDAWQRIPQDDPIMTGDFAPGLASSLHAMSLRQRFRASPPPRLDWPILYGVRDGERWMAIYSPYDLVAGITNHPCLDCGGYVPRDSRAILANIFLYIAQHQRVAASVSTSAKP
ncbi:MAG: DUF4159 domain-containing protein [Planctomycetes bacterium]|nr:DUF4159 domain-containing protein [Planctomycetota bacterium]